MPMDITNNNMETTDVTCTQRPIHLFLRELLNGEKMLPTDFYLDMWGELHMKGKVSFWNRKYRKDCAGLSKHYRICHFASSDFMMGKVKG